ncbi:hypothetical protein JCM19233_7145 [Vibrio astriarenae]|nr:hypothetical protein JCM19233_7145 [Vibrio sp. C7]
MTIHQPPSTYILRYFQDVEVLPPISWYPQTLGWQILGAITLALLAYGMYARLTIWYHNRYRSEAKQAIESLSLENEQFPRELFTIMKVVLSYLSPGNSTAFGSPFFQTLDCYHSLSLPQPLQQRWTLSLVSCHAHLSDSEKQQLKHYC